MQHGRARRACRAHPRENIEPVARQGSERHIAEPVDVAQVDAACLQRLPRADDHARALRVQMDDVERLAQRDADAAALADRVMDDAVVAAEHAPVDMDDVARRGRSRLQLGDDVEIAPLRHEADVLAVGLGGDRHAHLPGERADLGLGHAAERKAQIVHLFLRGREQEIALVAIGVERPVERPVAAARGPRADVVAGGQGCRAQFARRLQKVGELDRLVARHAGDGRLAGQIALVRTGRSPLPGSGARN